MRAAEVARAANASVTLCDAQPSVGRKFLVAGRGGLNLTHGEPVENFPQRYDSEPERWRYLLREFGPDDLRAWADELSVETYVGTSGRVFPRGQKAAILLRAWLRRLRLAGVQFRTGARLTSLQFHDRFWRAELVREGEPFAISAEAVVLALGGASWPETGSEGTWPALFAAHDIEITPWSPANCGWEIEWPAAFLEKQEGQPLKNLTVSAGGESVSGELLITRYGIEGGAIYRLGPKLRAMQSPEIAIDLKPQLSAAALRARLTRTENPAQWLRAVKLSPSAVALLKSIFPEDLHEIERLIARIKRISLPLRGPRPIAEAISSAGGVAWTELTAALMIGKMPGVFVAGEMIDWEAPTGGYLLQGCFSTGTRAGRSAADFAASVGLTR